MMHLDKFHGNAVLAALMLALGACENGGEPIAEPSPTRTPEPDTSKSPISILRESPEPILEPAVPQEPFDATVPFAEGGTALSDQAAAVIAEIVASRQFELGGKITLRGHTDSVGHDKANLRASKKRAESVAKALENAGANAGNIEIIPIGEMRPIAPNAKLDGTADEEGRAMNRRVEVSVAAPLANAQASDRSEPQRPSTNEPS